MPGLICPTVDLRHSWMAARDEWDPGVQQPGSGLHPDDDVDSEAGFSAWVRRLSDEANTALPPAEGRVHADYWWIVDDHTYPPHGGKGWRAGHCARSCRALNNWGSIVSSLPATTPTLIPPALSKRPAEY